MKQFYTCLLMISFFFKSFDLFASTPQILESVRGGVSSASLSREQKLIGFKDFLSKLQNGKITPRTKASELLPQLSVFSHENIKSFLDAIDREEFSELSQSLRRRIMFVSYFVQNEDDLMRDTSEVISTDELFNNNESTVQRYFYFEADAIRVYKAIINPEEAGKSLLYKYSREEPFYVMAWNTHENGSIVSNLCYWEAGSAYNSLFMENQSLKKIDSEKFLKEVKVHRTLTGAKVQKPRDFIKDFFSLKPDSYLLYFELRFFKRTLAWAFKDVAFQNGGFFSSEDFAIIVDYLKLVKSGYIKECLLEEFVKYVKWNQNTHHFCQEEVKKIVKQILLIANRPNLNSLPKELIIKIIETLF